MIVNRKHKILVVIPSLRIRSGVVAHVMNYYKNINDRFEIDFIVYSEENNLNTETIKKNGGKIFYFEKNFLKCFVAMNNFFANHKDEYDIVHCHTFNYGLPCLVYAKKYGVKCRIIHMHNPKFSDSFIKNILNYFLFKACVKTSNVYVACSEQTGQKMFGKRSFTIVKNAIDLSGFTDEDREQTRNELGIKNDVCVFGNVGRLVDQKNQIFALEVFRELKNSKKYKTSKLLLIGTGPKLHDIKNYISEHNLTEDFIYIQSATNMAKYYAAMDCFIFPSKYEGLGITLIEAQAAGLPCFCSDKLPKEAFATNGAKRVALSDGVKGWSKIILCSDLSKRNNRQQLVEAGFDIESESAKLVNFYHRILQKEYAPRIDKCNQERRA